MQVAEVRVWDPFVRIFHWLLATVVLVDWFMVEPLWMHTWLGYLAVGWSFYASCGDLSDQRMLNSSTS